MTYKVLVQEVNVSLTQNTPQKRLVTDDKLHVLARKEWCTFQRCGSCNFVQLFKIHKILQL